MEQDDQGEADQENNAANPTQDNEMDVDIPQDADPNHTRSETDDLADDGEDDDDETGSYVCMVPMADMLNARYGSENVCDVDLIFY